MDDAHATAAATHRCFHNEGIADLPSDLLRLRRRLDRILGSWQNRHSRRSGQPSGGRLVPKQLEKIRRRTNEGLMLAFSAGPGERGILRKKTANPGGWASTPFSFCQCDRFPPMSR